MHAVSMEQLAEISRRIALRMVSAFGLDCSSVALDMTNFATFIDTGNGMAPIAQRGKAKQKRCDLRLTWAWMSLPVPPWKRRSSASTC